MSAQPAYPTRLVLAPIRTPDGQVRIARVSWHAAERHAMRYRLGLDINHAMAELAQVIQLAQPHRARPRWLSASSKPAAFYLCAGQLTMPVVEDARRPGQLVIVTVLPPSSQHPSQPVVARRRRRAIKAAARREERQGRRARQRRRRGSRRP